MLVKELLDGALEYNKWSFHESSVYELDEIKAEEFDKDFELWKKEYKPSQELFYIYSKSRVID